MTSPPNDLDAWLHRLQQLHPAEIELGLQRANEVAGRMSLGRLAQHVIVVAGTNGKGSTIAALAALLALPHAGFAKPRLGVYTSPHLQSFRERIVVDNEQVSERQLCDAFNVVERARQSTPLTFFEFTTLAAMHVFQSASLDYAILEVGLGGRLDAVNIVDGDVTVITPIALDHQDWLGSSREEIAKEKAGILRAGGVAIVGDSDPPASLLSCAAELDCQLQLIGREFGYRAGQHHSETVPERIDSDDDCYQWWHVQSPASAQYRGLPEPSLHPANWSTAMAVAQQFAALPPAGELANLWANTSVSGRQQAVQLAERNWLLDVAHNEQSVACLARALDRNPVAGQTIAVFAAMRDKDIVAMLAEIAGRIDQWILPSMQTVDRAMAPEVLATTLAEFAEQGALLTTDNVRDSINAAIQSSSQLDKILVFGSFYLVGAVLDEFDDMCADASALISGTPH